MTAADGCHEAYHDLGVHEPGKPAQEGTPARSLADMAGEVAEVNRANGWFDEERSHRENLALLHSEVSEALEAYRTHGFEDATHHVSATGALPKPEGVGSELADVLIRLLDTCHRTGVHPDWWHSTLADVDPRFSSVLPDDSFGDAIAELHRLIATNHLRLFLSALVAVAQKAGVDLQTEYDRKIAFNRTRSHRHGGKRL